MAGKPDIRISARRKDAQKGDWGVDLGAGWRENGRVSMRWDRKIKRVLVELDDGTRHTMSPDEWWLNAREESQSQSPQRPQQRSAGRTHTRVVADADMPDGDDIPF